MTVASEFNNYFTTIGKKLLNQLPDIRHDANPMNVIQKLSDFEDTDPVEIKEILGALNENSAKGPDGISLKLLKSLGEEFCFYLSNEINASFRYRIFPDSLKVARVLPIYQEGNLPKEHEILSTDLNFIGVI